MALEGVDELRAALTGWGSRMHAATGTGVEAGTQELKQAVQDNLARSEYPPASPPGEPPALRSGYLHDEVYADSTPVDTGAYGEVWPSTVYARIQELSGWAGRDHASFLPARPYVEPALDAFGDRFGQIMFDAWASAEGG